MAFKLLGRCYRRIGSLDYRRKVILLLILTVTVYGTFILVDTFVLNNVIKEDWWTPADLDVYRERTTTILEGRLLYRDVHTETPPLINYLLVPVQALGGEEWMYATYFSFFSFLTGCTLYLGLRRWDEMSAFVAGALFILSPFAVTEATLGVEDETVIAFVYLLPLVLLMHERRRLSALWLGLGVWTKMFSILLYPVLLLKTAEWRERIIHILLIALVTLAVAGPFLALCPDDFGWFLRFYFLGVEGRETGGQSLWHFLERGGIPVPGELMTVVTGIGLLLAIWYCYKRNLSTWQTALVITVTFFTFYPKIHLGYFLMPTGLLMVWGSRDMRIAARCILLFAPIMTAVSFAESSTGAPFFDYEWGWIAGFFASLAGTLLLVETSWRALRQKSFLDQDKEEESGSRATSELTG